MPERPVKAFCLGCGYSLVELKSRQCPECGRTFDPQDESTWTASQWVSAIRRTLTSHGAPIELGSLALATAMTLYGFLPPGQYDWAIQLATVCWLTTAAVWTFRATTRALWPRAQRRLPFAPFLIRSAPAPIAAAICIYLVYNDLTPKWTMNVFQGDFSRAVQKSNSTGLTLPSASRAGPYVLVRRPITRFGIIWFSVQGDSHSPSESFVYVPDQDIPFYEQWHTPGVTQKRLAKNWYLQRKYR